jgi:signal transduction histidine kinase
MTAINVQAGVAAHLLARDPGQAHGALRDIKRVSGEALAELRATLEVLRDPGQAAPRAPSGSLHELGRLARDVRAAGVEVQLDVAPIAGIPGPVDHAAYRIVQEALTNVARHAGAAHARVTVGLQRGVLTIEVADDGCGAGAGAGAAGNGLRGMAERARALGGTLEASDGPEGGFAVRARLPLTRPVSTLAPAP